MDAVDKQLLNMAQRGLPLTGDPFHRLGEELGLSADEVVSRLNALRKEGYIRRIGGVFDSRKMGFISTLMAAQVPEKHCDDLAAKISRHSAVTHCYRRDGSRFNLWFTLTAADEKQKNEIVRDIKGCNIPFELYDFPAENVFKLHVFFEMKEDEC